MATPSKIKLSELDFDAIKENLKSYLKDQSEFQDYNFEGSAINILLDILAYNTHYNSFYMNMIANEMFLDSASLRSSVVSHAKLLGYTPRSATTSKAVVNVSITKATTDSTTLLTIPRFTPFITDSLNGTSYRFLSTTDQTVANTGRTFKFTNLELKEGQESSYVFVVDNQTNGTQTFVLPDYNIDTSTLQIAVQKSATNSDRSIYKLAQDATEVTSESKVFYLEENINGLYQIYFGDGIIGKRLDQDNLVIATYIVSNGVQADGLGKFKLQYTLLPGSTSATTALGKSSGASYPELLDDIKFSAPKAFIAQNRAVTKNDYITLLNKKYPYFDAVTVWGGEEQDPPVYGKVFISAKPKLAFDLTEEEKNYVIETIIKPISVLTVTPEFIDPDYNFINLTVTAKYNPDSTNKTPQQIKSIIRQAVAEHAASNYNSFNASFYKSRLLRDIDDSESSIRASDVDVILQKKLEPALGVSENYILNFATSLIKGSGAGEGKLYSSPYFELEDNFGITRQCYIEESPKSFTGIDEIVIVKSGSGYTKTPTITIQGDGSGAEAYPIIVNGRIQSVVVSKRGIDYTTATATLSGGGTKKVGTIKPLIQGNLGTLRIFYYDSSGNKVILVENAGSIEYSTGIVKLNNFAPIAIGKDLFDLSIFVKPATSNFSSDKNRLMTYDSSVGSSLTVNLIAVGE
jgi:hypothetical protein